MKSYATVYNRRCKPLMGTFVEIGLLGATEAIFVDAFSAINKVSRLMSFHDEESDLSRLNRAPIGQWITLDNQIIEVLKVALEIQIQSGGLFNVAIAQPLMFWKILPGETSNAGLKYLSSAGFEVQGMKARRILPVKIDLGGIAKGYAVDRAVVAIQKHSREISGIVNAGGDLRVFGETEHPIWIQDGITTSSKKYFTKLRNTSLATSSVIPLKKISNYIDPISCQLLLEKKTAIARAEHCVLADAFTKVALLLPFDQASELGSRFHVDLSLVS